MIKWITCISIAACTTAYFGCTSNDKTSEAAVNEQKPATIKVFEPIDSSQDLKLPLKKAESNAAHNAMGADSGKVGQLPKKDPGNSPAPRGEQPPHEQAGQPGPPPDGPPGVEEIFAQMDANKDGKLSKEEVKGPLLNDFSKVDINGDGFISKEELTKAPKPGRQGPPPGKTGQQGPPPGGK